MQLMRQAIARGGLASDALGAMQKTISSDSYFISFYLFWRQSVTLPFVKKAYSRGSLPRHV